MPLFMIASGVLQAATGDVSWNQFRGPNDSGVADGFKPPTRLDARSLIWKRPVGPGLSSPVLSLARIFVTAVDGERLVTLAFDAASGKPAWRQLAPAMPAEKVHKVNSPATPTPYVDDGRVHVYFGAYGLLCYDFEGANLGASPSLCRRASTARRLPPSGMATT